MGGEPVRLLAGEVRHRERIAVCGRPDGLRHVPEVEAAGVKRAVPEHGERSEPGREGRDGEGERSAQRARSRIESQRLPRTSSLAWRRYAASPPAAMRARKRVVGGEPAQRFGERLRVAGRDEERALLVDEQLARGRRVGGDERRGAGERLERLVRDHPRGLVRAAEDPERSACRVELAGEPLVLDPGHPLDVRGARLEEPVELPRADDAERELGREPRRFEDRLQPVQRDQLADEERVREGAGRTRPKDPLLRADEADLDPLEVGELGKEAGVLLRVRDDDVGRAERAAVDERERARGKRTGLEARAIGDERVRERDERVEDHRRAPRRASCRRQVEVAGVADDHRVVALGRPPEQTKLRPREAQRRCRACAPRVARSLPHRLVPFDDLDTRAAQARDHLRVARVVALVRSEVENFQERISSTCSSSRPRSSARSSWCVVIISPISPSERNCIPTTTSRTPSVSRGRCPIALPLSQRTVR